jgi:SRSO17 transposase
LLKHAGLPADTPFQTKWELALKLIDEALGWDITRGVVVCDIAYGKINEFRQALIDRNLFYLAEVESRTIILAPRQSSRHHQGRPKKAPEKPVVISVKELAQSLPTWKWKTIRWRQGAKKSLVSRFAAIRVEPAHGYRQNNPLPPGQWLLMEWPDVRRSRQNSGLPISPPQAGLRRLVCLAKTRWRVEQNYQQLKEELGLDHYEGRGFLGWHHHVTMNMMAYGFLLLETIRSKKNFWIDPPDDPVDAPKNVGHLDRGLPYLQKEGFP